MSGRLRLRGAWGWTRENASGIRWVIRRPLTARKSWVNVGAWALALVLAVAAVIYDIVAMSWGWLFWNGAVGGMDLYMLTNAVIGLRWRLQQDKDNPPPKRERRRKVRGRRKGSPRRV